MDEILPLPSQDYTVLVRCFCFNQVKYIEDALCGFVSQKTNFPFVVLIVDDCSTDGTQAVIQKYERDYPDIIKPIYLAENHRSIGKKKTPYVIPWRNRCKYEATCEGDDFWVDPLKLQRQVDWMESHPDCSMCCSDAKILTQCGELDWSRYSKDCDIPVSDMILGGGLFVQTCTVLFRIPLRAPDFYPQCCKKCHVGDYPLQIWATLNGDVHYFATKMGAYRFQRADSWTTKNSSLSYLKKIKGIRSEVDMLQGLDKISELKYHKAFTKRQVDFVSSFAFNCASGIRPKADIKAILEEFADVRKMFGFSKKIDVFLLFGNLSFIYRVKRKVGHLLCKLLSIKESL